MAALLLRRGALASSALTTLACLTIAAVPASAQVVAPAQTPTPDSAPKSVPPAGPVEQAAPPQRLGGDGDEIVVTARQRNETLLSVPVAVTAVTATELQRTGATDLVRIAQLAPQVQIARSASGGGASFVIRGIGSQPQEPNLDQTVAINVDGVLVNRGRVAQLGQFDLQQVEILKGPQALFFGKNSPAGVISLVSNRPTDTLTGYVRGGYEFEARERFVEGAISGPLTDTLKARLAVRYSGLDGWIQNRALPQANPWAPQFPLPGRWSKRVPGGDEYLARLTLAYEPSSTFDATLRLFGAIHHDNDFAGGQQLRCVAPTTRPVNYGFFDPSSDCRADGFMSKSGMPAEIAATIPLAKTKSYTDLSALLGGLTLNWRPTDEITVTSITGFLHLRSKGWGEYSGTAIGQVWSGGEERTDTQSQELRVTTDFESPLNFTVGAFYEHSFRYTFAPQFIQYRGPDPVTGKYGTSERFARNYSDSYSTFVQARYAITDQLELAGGARFSGEDKRIRIGTTYVHARAAAAQAQVGQVIARSYNDSNISPEATLTWRPTPNQTLYTAYKTGYKSGGFANPTTLSRVFQNDPSLLELQNESAKGGEIGYKASLFDRLLRIETAIYSYTFSDLQVSSYDADSATFQTRNAAKARTRGAELSLRLQPADGLSLIAAGGYNDARYKSFPDAPCYLGQNAAEGCNITVRNGRNVSSQDFSGRRLHRAPAWVLNFGGSYDQPIGRGLKMGVSADAQYSSSYRAGENLAPASLQESFWRLNNGIRLYPEDEKWELALIGRNLTNEFVLTQASDQPGGSKGSTTTVTPRPREIILQATLRF